MTLTEFLLARFAEDKARFHVPDWYCTDSARGEGWGSRGGCPLCGAYMFVGTESVTEDAMANHFEQAHDSLRVRREVEAKRRILDLHEPTGTSLVAVTNDPPGIDEGDMREIEPDSFEDIVNRDVNCMACAGYPSAPCATLRALASVYADHPDFDPAWA